MNKVRVVVLGVLVLALLMVGAVSAEGPGGPSAPVPYEDAAGGYDAESEFNAPEGTGVLGSVILNGAFDDWGANGPMNWTLWTDSKSGWETARVNKVDLASGEGTNDGMGFFVRNVGGSGGYYAGAAQQLNVPSGTYFINVSETIWYGGDTAPYNSVAWYAISDAASAADVASGEWRELDPYVYQCPDGDGRCVYSGRDEMVAIESGQYFHVMVGMKFPVYNAWSFFVIDDISVVPATTVEDTVNGYYDWSNDSPDDFKWHWYDEYCIGCSPTEVHWNPAVTH